MKLWVSLAVKAKVRPEERQDSRGTAMLNALILTTLYCLSQAQMGGDMQGEWRNVKLSQVEGKKLCNYVCRMTTYHDPVVYVKVHAEVQASVCANKCSLI